MWSSNKYGGKHDRAQIVLKSLKLVRLLVAISQNNWKFIIKSKGRTRGVIQKRSGCSTPRQLPDEQEESKLMSPWEKHFVFYQRLTGQPLQGLIISTLSPWPHSVKHVRSWSQTPTNEMRDSWCESRSYFLSFNCYAWESCEAKMLLICKPLA